MVLVVLMIQPTSGIVETAKNDRVTFIDLTYHHFTTLGGLIGKIYVMAELWKLRPVAEKTQLMNPQ